jgi:hypothetical protein
MSENFAKLLTLPSERGIIKLAFLRVEKELTVTIR